MSAVDKLAKELQSKSHQSGQKLHTQTVSLDSAMHDALIRLAETLDISKTALASRLLTAAITDLSTKILTGERASQPSDPPAAADSPVGVAANGLPRPGSSKGRRRY
jgi:hypothetical protein